MAREKAKTATPSRRPTGRLDYAEAPRLEVRLVPDETGAVGEPISRTALFDAWLVLHLPTPEGPVQVTVRLDGGPFDDASAKVFLYNAYLTIGEKYAKPGAAASAASVSPNQRQ